MYKFIDEFSQFILDSERYLWKTPETGYREYKTNAYMIEQFEKLGYKLERPKDITGFYTVVDTGRKGPTVLVFAELDSLINRSHPECDKSTGAVHTCGHHAQCAMMLGLAKALKQEGALDGLSGKIKLCVVPAEEGIEISYRKELVNKGVITYTSGKPEFISRGYFDDVDIAFMVHADVESDTKIKFKAVKGHNGVIRKRTTVKGKASHAGESPDQGINALNAASLIILAINSLRETFKEKYQTRIHSIIEKGGDVVNSVPDEVIIESYVRALDPIMHKKINDSVNRAISASAVAIGATTLIEDFSGSESFIEDENLRSVAFEVFEEIAGKDGYEYTDEILGSSTDMGDVGSLFPSIHVYTTGGVGTLHGKDFFVDDAYNMCVNGTKFQYGLIRKLLENNAEKAKDIISKYKPIFSTIKEYLAHKNSINMCKDTVVFNDDGTITIDYKS